MKKSQTGFSLFELVLVAAIVGVVGLIGYGVYNRHQIKTTNNQNPSLTQPTTSATVSSAPTVNSTSDLDKALQTLDQNDPTTADTSDSNQLNSQLSF